MSHHPAHEARLAPTAAHFADGDGRGDGRPSEGRGDGKRGQPQPPRRPGAMTWVMLVALAGLVYVVLTSSGPQGTKVSWPQLMTFAKEGKIQGPIEMTESQAIARLKPGSVPGLADDKGNATTVRVAIDPRAADTYYGELRREGIDHEVNVGSSFLGQLFLTIIGPLLLFGLLIFFLSRSMRGAGGGPGGMLGSFGKSRHRVQTKESVNITFADVAGIDEAKEEVTEIVEFLKNPKRFQKLGGRIPRGVLLEGPPGCGKTLLAKAIAGEADVPFFSISGSDFVEMFVGVGASRVRDLFKQAKENSPCIIFLDEIDAVGRRRGGGFTTGGHDEREQTLNAILVEMDGFGAADGVIVIAATNRADVLDPALTRPGRFDRVVGVSLPDLAGRRQILGVHAKKVRMSPDVDLDRLARATPMFSGADLAALINEAAIIATMADKEVVEMADLEEARDKVRWGRAKKSKRIEEQERVATAYHEAGHAVLQVLLSDADPLHKVTIIPRGQAMGTTFSLPEKDRYGYGRKYCEATMRVLCAGRIAESKKTGDVSSGAGMDIKMVTRIARAMVLEWGMSDRLGFVSYRGEDNREAFIPEKDYSPDTARLIDEEIRHLADTAFADASRAIDQHWDQVSAVAEALLRHETLSRDDVERLMRGEKVAKPTVADLLGAEMAKPSAKPALPAPDAADAGDAAGGALPSPA
ncbi:MAG: ATP-dependent zinc metalloprotease FtsH [Planctomycetota bacterium]